MRDYEVSIKLKNLGEVEGLVKHKSLFSFYIVLFRCLNNCSFFSVVDVFCEEEVYGQEPLCTWTVML